MHKIFAFFKNDRTVKSTTLMVGGYAGANVGAYLYHIFIGRLLLPADYGALQSLISLTNILNFPLVTLRTVVAKFVSAYVGKGEFQKISSLYYTFRKTLIIFLFFGGMVFLLLSQTIMNFLHLESWVNVVILDIALFFGLLNSLNRATLQGLSLFGALTVTQFIEAYGKVLFGVVAVLAGLGVPGAFGSFVFVIFMSFTYMVFVLHKKLVPFSAHRLPLRAMSHYAIPSALMTIGVTALYNTDVVLVRHFLSPYETGLYAASSVLGKIIFFGTSPVATTMFPLVSEAHARGDGYHRIFLSSLIFLIAVAGVITLVFSFLPALAIKILIGVKYLEAASYLSRFSIFLSMCAVINLLTNFFLSIHKTHAVYIVVVGAMVQAVAIFVYHPNISAIVTTSLIISTIIAIILSLYYIYIARP